MKAYTNRENSMENQHRHIKGYRELIPEEIDLMNRIKEKGAELLALQDELNDLLMQQMQDKYKAALSVAEKERIESTAGAEYWLGHVSDESTPEYAELERFKKAEPLKWAQIGKTDIETGVMALVRAVAQPG